MSRFGVVLIYVAFAFLAVIPIGIAVMSPLLAWREPIYRAAGFAGVIAITLMLLQPLLAAGYLPGLSIRRGRHLHRWVGGALVLSLVIHVAGLWLTSPPDVVDALLFNSPTPFSNWGVIAMWAVFASACLALFRRKFRTRLGLWRLSHKSLAGVIVIGSAVHAMKVDGTMEIISKSFLCVVLVVVTGLALMKFKQRN